MLGANLRFGNLSMFEPYNVINAREARVKMPITGDKTSGFVIADASINDNFEWQLKHCEVRTRAHRLILVGSKKNDPLAPAVESATVDNVTVES
eukprot:CFRG4896T1